MAVMTFLSDYGLAGVQPEALDALGLEIYGRVQIAPAK